MYKKKRIERGTGQRSLTGTLDQKVEIDRWFFASYLFICIFCVCLFYGMTVLLSCEISRYECIHIFLVYCRNNFGLLFCLQFCSAATIL